MLVRVVDGVLKPKDKIQLHGQRRAAPDRACGVFTPKSVGPAAAVGGRGGLRDRGIKELKAAQVGDTITLLDRPAKSRCRAPRLVCSPEGCSPVLNPVESHDLRHCATP